MHYRRTDQKHIQYLTHPPNALFSGEYSVEYKGKMTISTAVLYYQQVFLSKYIFVQIPTMSFVGSFSCIYRPYEKDLNSARYTVQFTGITVQYKLCCVQQEVKSVQCTAGSAKYTV